MNDVRHMRSLEGDSPLRAAVDDDFVPGLDERAEDVAALPEDAPVPSPCINVCRIDPGSGLCTGCRRTLDEIAAWSRLDDAGKRIVWAQLPARGTSL